MTAARGPTGRLAAYLTAPSIAAVVVAGALLLGGESPALALSAPRPLAGTSTRTLAHARALRHKAERPKAKRPKAKPAPRWALDIPSIGVATALMRLGEPTSGAGGLSLPTPPLAKAGFTAGWYQFTARPGTAGNAVIAGHVDTYFGPGAFYNLYELRPGAAVYVTAGGARQRFEVTSAREMSKDDFPVNQVFGATGRHQLWLITCGGDFDYTTGHYLDNIVISATWIPPKEKKAATHKKLGA